MPAESTHRRSNRQTARRRPSKSKTSARAAGRKRSTYTHPPVQVRGSSYSEGMARSKAGRNSRRRYDISLSVPGAEMRLPALPTFRFGWRAFSFLMTVLLASALFYIWNSPIYQVSDLEITGLKRLTTREISNLLQLNGQPVFMVDAGKILDTLQEEFADLSSISVQVELPARVLISVVEREPVLSWQQGDRTLWVDAQGISFPVRGEQGPSIQVIAEDSPSQLLPLSTEEATEENAQLLTPEFVTAVENVYSIAPQGIPLIYTTEHGLGWQDKRGWQAFVGMDYSNIEMKLSIYQAIVRYVKENEIHPAMVSVEYVHAPYYRLAP